MCAAADNRHRNDHHDGVIRYLDISHPLYPQQWTYQHNICHIYKLSFFFVFRKKKKLGAKQFILFFNFLQVVKNISVIKCEFF